MAAECIGRFAGLDVPAEATAASTVVLGIVGSLGGGWLAPSPRAWIAEVVPSPDEIATAVTTPPALTVDAVAALMFQTPGHANQQVTGA